MPYNMDSATIELSGWPFHSVKRLYPDVGVSIRSGEQFDVGQAILRVAVNHTHCQPSAAIIPAHRRLFRCRLFPAQGSLLFLHCR